MPRSYLLLTADKKTPVARTRGGYTASRAGADKSKISISIERTSDPQKIQSLMKRDKSIVMAVPAMPLKLIKEHSKKSIVINKDTPITSWGIEAVNALQSNYTGKGINVAVLDTGIDRNHKCFDGVHIVEKDFTGEGDGDSDGHGTHCAGTIFGQTIDNVRIGIAPGIDKAIIGKILGNNDTNSTHIYEAIMWAIDEGAHIISMSLGIDFPGYVAQLIEEEKIPPAVATSMALDDFRRNIAFFEKLTGLLEASALASVKKPALLIAASGNESQRPDFTIVTSLPAVSKGFISVGALEKNGDQYHVASFSNNEPTVSAPGVDILSADLGEGYVEMSGTSMATPHVAGVAALYAQKMLAHRTSLDIAQLTSLITSNCKTDKLVNDDYFSYGTGIVQGPAN